MKTWSAEAKSLQPMPPVIRTLTNIYYGLLAALLASVIVAVLGWLWWTRSGHGLLLVFAPVAIYLLMKVYLSFVLLPAIFRWSPPVTDEQPVGFDRPPNRDRVLQGLEAVKAAGGDGLRWIEEGVREWLSAPDGVEKDRARNALLDRLYAYSASSNGDYHQRKVVNDLRLAINPWIEE